MIRHTDEYIICEHEGNTLHYLKDAQGMCKVKDDKMCKMYPYECLDVIYAKFGDSECAKEFVFEIAKYRSDTFAILKNINNI